MSICKTNALIGLLMISPVFAEAKSNYLDQSGTSKLSQRYGYYCTQYLEELSKRAEHQYTINIKNACFGDDQFWNQVIRNPESVKNTEQVIQKLGRDQYVAHVNADEQETRVKFNISKLEEKLKSKTIDRNDFVKLAQWAQARAMHAALIEFVGSCKF